MAFRKVILTIESGEKEKTGILTGNWKVKEKVDGTTPGEAIGLYPGNSSASSKLGSGLVAVYSTA